MTERSQRVPKRKSGEISKPGMSCRGVRLRDHHYCNETKILDEVKMNVDYSEIRFTDNIVRPVKRDWAVPSKDTPLDISI